MTDAQIDAFPKERINHSLHPNRRFTTPRFMKFIKDVAHVDAWDLDPAAEAESHWAPRWFSLTDEPGTSGVDGLKQSWQPPVEWFDSIDERQRRLFYGSELKLLAGPDSWHLARTWRCFINPPFDVIEPWLEKLWNEVLGSDGFFFRIAMVLPANRPEQPFWQKHVEPYRDGRFDRFNYRLETYYPPGRQSYGHPGCPEGKGSPEFASVVLVWRAFA